MRTRHNSLPVIEIAPGRVVVGHGEVIKRYPVAIPNAGTVRQPQSLNLTIVELELTLPYMVSGKNSVKTTRTGKRYPTERFVTWRNAALRQIAKQLNGHSHLNNQHVALRCDIRYWPNDKRVRDVPGMEDAIYHCLERAGVIANDGQIKHTSFTTEALQDEVRLIVSLRVCP